jgi:hypothetical protein
MAESIAVLFSSASWDELTQYISQLAESCGNKNWRYPKNDNEYSLSLYEYDSWLDECEPDDVLKIKDLLGNKASAVLCMEMRRSKQLQACEDSVFLCKKLLNKFHGIVDDAMDQYWEKESIENNDFLKCYK